MSKPYFVNPSNEDTSNGRQPQNIKSEIWARETLCPMEEDLNVLKLEYLSNCLLDYTQILNLSLDDQTTFSKPSK